MPKASTRTSQLSLWKLALIEKIPRPSKEAGGLIEAIAKAVSCRPNEDVAD
jgi:hypothetical protein